MRSIILNFIIVLSLCSFSFELQGQEEQKDAFKMISRATESEVMLRWAPNSPTVLDAIKNEGCIVVRHTVLRNGKVTPFSERSVGKQLSPTPIKPASETVWKGLMAKSDFAKVAAQALFGKGFEVSNEVNDIGSIINASREQNNRFGFALFAADQSTEVAEAMGLMYVDKDIKEGERYLYKVYAAGSSGSQIDTGFTLAGKEDFYPLPKPLYIKAEFDDRVVEVSWNKKYFNDIYSAYFIERSADNGQTYQRLNEKPFVNLTNGQEQASVDASRAFYLDSLPRNGKLYMYRVIGRTPFGEMSPPSDAVAGMGQNGPLGLHPALIGSFPGEDGFNIVWRFPEDYNSELKGFRIERANKAEGPYEILNKNLLPPNERNFTDPKPNPTNYYKITAIDLNDNPMSSYPGLAQLEDSTPPAAPTGVRGIIDSTGVMKVVWDLGNEPDLMGWRVYIGNKKGAEFKQITKDVLTRTVFIDTISMRMANAEVYVKIMALDFHHNPSTFSEIQTIRRPDLIPPSPPAIGKIDATEDRLFFDWHPSSSLDVAGHKIYRKYTFSENWELVKEYENKEIKDDMRWVDVDAKPGYKYHYKVEAIDLSGYVTPSIVIESGKVKTGMETGISNEKGKADRENKQVELTWLCKDGKEKYLSRFVIYRAYGNAKPVAYESLDPTKALGTDGKRYVYKNKQVKMNTSYTYQIKAVYADGAESPLSKKIKVNY